MITLTTLMVFVSAGLSAPAQTCNAPSGALVSGFMQAWSASDPKRLSRLFAQDADLVTPDCTRSTGRENIEAFYDAVFAHGYRGSIGRGEVVSERALSPDISLIDAQWSISGARTPGGAPRGDETGIMAAVIGRTEEGWRILALRENGGASTFSPFPPTR